MRLLSLNLLFVCCQLACSNIGHAQTEDQEKSYDRAVQLSVIHLVAPFEAGPRLSFEHRIKGTHFLRHEIGWVAGYGNSYYEDVTKASGFQLRTGYRKYEPYTKGSRRRWFRDITLTYRALTLETQDNFQLGQYSHFRQVLPFDLELRSIAIAIAGGHSLRLGKQERWQLNIGIGVGLRLNHRTYESLPEGVTMLEDDSFINIPSISDYNHKPGYSLGLAVPIIGALGYRF